MNFMSKQTSALLFDDRARHVPNPSKQLLLNGTSHEKRSPAPKILIPGSPPGSRREPSHPSRPAERPGLSAKNLVTSSTPHHSTPHTHTHLSPSGARKESRLNMWRPPD
ncbi:hypothetical protein MHYP_G00014510 [Metynnis hypsauchen]